MIKNIAQWGIVISTEATYSNWLRTLSPKFHFYFKIYVVKFVGPIISADSKIDSLSIH